jgi:hypothetical protein
VALYSLYKKNEKRVFKVSKNKAQKPFKRGSLDIIGFEINGLFFNAVFIGFQSVI